MIDRSDPIFSDESAARVWLESQRWPDGPVCPWCGRHDTPRPLNGKSMGEGWYHCRECRKKFTVRAGTMYERSHVPLHKWLHATLLLTAGNRQEVTVDLLHFLLGVSYKTAWTMTRRIKDAIRAVAVE